MRFRRTDPSPGICRLAICAALMLALVLVASGRVAAQGRADVNAGQFEFSLPGARSLGMGGAFLAVARDASAAYSNPAGLVFLTELEASIELRDWSFTNTAMDRGHGFGEPSGNGIDTIPGLVEKEFTADRQGVSFLSLVYPRRKWTVGIFRHEIPRYLTRKRIQGPFFDCSGGFRTDVPVDQEPFCSDLAREDGIDRLFPKDQEIQIDIFSWGASFAYRLDRVPLSFGISVLYYDFEFDALNILYSARGEQKFTPPNYSEGNIELTSTQQGNDSEIGINAGFLWESSRWSVAGAFREGPEFDFAIQRLAGPAHDAVLDGQLEVGDVLNEIPNNSFKVPDTWAIGVAFRPRETMTLSLQYDLVRFSQLTKDFQEPFLGPNEREALSNGLETNDANRIRLGFEKLWLRSGQIFAFRVGSWYDSEHRTHFRADPETGHPAPRWAILFPEGDDEIHYSLGGGVVLKEKLQLDVAVDVSDVVDTYSLSVVWRFGKKKSPQERAAEALDEARARMVEEAEKSVSEEKGANGGE